jgi:hypothetical protein
MLDLFTHQVSRIFSHICENIGAHDMHIDIQYTPAIAIVLIYAMHMRLVSLYA